MRLSKRTCFRMTGGGGVPFFIGARVGQIGIMKARFGIYTCGNDGRFRAALVRKVISVCPVKDSRMVAQLAGSRFFKSCGKGCGGAALPSCRCLE